MKLTIDAREVQDEEDLYDVLDGIAKMVRDGFTSGISMPPGVHWSMSGEWAEEDDDPDYDDDGNLRAGVDN